MRHDYEEVRSAYTSIYSVLKKISDQIEEQLTSVFENVPHIDRIISRVKSIDSFLTKSDKLKEDGTLKYPVPMKEIQDMIGVRIVVYYKTDVQTARDILFKRFQRVEEVSIVPDDVSKFGYEGFHMICFIPNTIFSSRENPLVGNFFELQIKTLYQHAWSQSNHGLGYKPGMELTGDQQRQLAFISAQSWGADKILSELVTGDTPEGSH
jgi:putative GTP pyrophosphokinase